MSREYAENYDVYYSCNQFGVYPPPYAYGSGYGYGYNSAYYGDNAFQSGYGTEDQHQQDFVNNITGFVNNAKQSLGY
jgi:hypothetical protein